MDGWKAGKKGDRSAEEDHQCGRLDFWFDMYPKVYLYKRIKDAKIIIDRDFADKIDLDHIARRVYLSKYHFLRLFKEAYGHSPHQYLIIRRIEKAKQMLASEDSVIQVCHDVGFESLPSFSNLFKKHTGLSPSQYRAQH